jgi:hypothetical protein
VFDQSAAEIGNRFEAVADPDLALSEGNAATVIALLKAILAELEILRAAATES